MLSAEEVPNTNAVVTLALAAQRLDNKDTFGRSDPFLKLSKARESGAWVPVLKSEVGGRRSMGWVVWRRARLAAPALPRP